MMEPQDTAAFSVPAGAWQLDIEPDPLPLVVGEEAPPVQQPKLNETKTISETPPPLGRIIEALLFASPQPLSAEKLGGIIRGLSPSLLEETIHEINRRYHRQARPYMIVANSNGYQLLLRGRFRQHLDSLYGGIKEVRLSQILVETLAVVAYRQPLNQLGVEAILGQDCSQSLRQLIRRGLVEIRGKDDENQPLYATTPRFLEFFQLAKVDDLPRADDMERL